MTREDLRIPAGGEQIAAWHWTGEGDAFAADGGRPCVVMAHGFGATRDSGLEGFAERFAAAGLDVLAFDPRHLGASSGEPRQLVSPGGQVADYASVIAHARTLPGVDAARIVAWGVSLSGGHVFQVAAQDGRLAAMIALTPAPDGLAALTSIMKTEGPRHGARLTAAGLRDLVAKARGRERVLVPTAGRPGTVAVLTAPGGLEAYEAIAGPTWRNETVGEVLLQIGLHRPGRYAGSIGCPVLVQVADDDQTAPPRAAMVAAKKARAEVRHYPCDHFDVYPGTEWFEAVVGHQLAFLQRRLGATTPATPEAARRHSTRTCSR